MLWLYHNKWWLLCDSVHLELLHLHLCLDTVSITPLTSFSINYKMGTPKLVAPIASVGGLIAIITMCIILFMTITIRLRRKANFMLLLWVYLQ